MLHAHVKQIQNPREPLMRIRQDLLFPRNQQDVVPEYMVARLPHVQIALTVVGDGLARLDIHVRVGTVLDQGQGQIIHVVYVRWRPRVFHHFDDTLEDVRSSLRHLRNANLLNQKNEI